MPIYEYRCLECGDETEVIQRVGSGPKRRCDKCSGRLEKLISRSSFHLKGGGWFAEGYTRGSSGKPKSKPSSSSAGSSSASGKPGKSDKKDAKASSG